MDGAVTSRPGRATTGVVTMAGTGAAKTGGRGVKSGAGTAGPCAGDVERGDSGVAGMQHWTVVLAGPWPTRPQQVWALDPEAGGIPRENPASATTSSVVR